MCQGLGYNLTSMPNFLGHEDQLQAQTAVNIDIKCFYFFFKNLFDIELRIALSLPISSQYIYGIKLNVLRHLLNYETSSQL